MRRVVMILLAFALLTAARDGADARRPRFVAAIPVENTYETVVKVLDLPHTPDFHARGTYFDLGYLMRSGGNGEWVGFVGSKTSYIPLGPETLKFVMRQAGLDALPPVPEPEVDWRTALGRIEPRLVLALLVPLVFAFLCIRQLRRRRPKIKIVLPTPAPTPVGDAKGGSDWVKKAHASVNAAAPPIESPIVRAARERAERLRQMTPAVRGQIAKSPELVNLRDFGRLGGRR